MTDATQPSPPSDGAAATATGTIGDISAASSNAADDALGKLQGKLHRWAVSQHQFLAGFAATKYTKDGPGALFVFANCGLDDLLVADEDPEFTTAKKLERQVILVWGGTTAKAGVS